MNEPSLPAVPVVANVSASAVLSSAEARDAAEDRIKARKELEEILQARLKVRMQTYADKHACNVLSAAGIIVHENRAYRVYFNTPAHNPWRQLRKKLGLTSGRQWRTFRKTNKLYRKLKQGRYPTAEQPLDNDTNTR
jgi:hypothetical protein